ncbi:MAG: PKD domain-containing protein, partial [Planctomycetota bacterium]|nr:PKD domain-containing protein [Planctomycetota bacterium]
VKATLNLTLGSSAFPRGLAWDGANLWVGNIFENKLYKINPSDGSVVSSFQVTHDGADFLQVFDLAWDGTNLWVLYTWMEKQGDQYINHLSVAKYNTAGSKLSGFEIPEDVDNCSLTWDGAALWIFPFSAAAKCRAYDTAGRKLYEFNPVNPDSINIWGLTWDGQHFWVEYDNNHFYKVDSGRVAWLKETSRKGTLAAGSSASITVTFDAKDLAAGTYTTRFKIASNDPDTPVAEVPVTFVVTDPGSNHPPVITAGPTAAPNPANVGQSVSFSVTASDADGDALTYTWDFGDGQTGSGASPTHSFSAAGTYTVTVTVSDGKGGTATGNVVVTVKAGTGPGDLNGDGLVNVTDLTIVTSNFGKSSGDPGFDSRADANGDGVVNVMDLTVVTTNFGKDYR